MEAAAARLGRASFDKLDGRALFGDDQSASLPLFLYLPLFSLFAPHTFGVKGGEEGDW